LINFGAIQSLHQELLLLGSSLDISIHADHQIGGSCDQLHIVSFLPALPSLWYRFVSEIRWY